MTQTTYSEQSKAVAGLIADIRGLAGFGKFSVLATEDLWPGTVLYWSDQNNRKTQNPPDFEQSTDDTSSLLTSTSTSTSEQTITSFDGSTGDGPLNYGYKVIASIDASADWDDTRLRIKGRVAETGRVETEELHIPDGGDVDLVTVRDFDRIDEVVLDAQSGSNGSFTLGYEGPPEVASKESVAGIALRKAATKETAKGSDVKHENEDVFTVARQGPVWCEIDQDVSVGDDVYVRVVADASGERKGLLRVDDDNGDAVRLPSEFRFQENATQSDLALVPVNVNLP